MRGNHWLFTAVVLFIIGLLWHQTPLLLVSLLVLLADGTGKLWRRYCLDRVDYRRELSARRVFFGEELHLDVEISNRKLLPLPWLQIDDEVPVEVTFLKGGLSSSHLTDRKLLGNFFSLSWYHRVRRRYPIRCLQRGFFTFGPARIRSGDLFGLFQREMAIPQLDYLMVYPRIVPLEKLGIASKQVHGDIKLRRHLFQDPVLTAGVRDYHFGDSLKNIHWKTTARLGRLQTKVFEPTTTVDFGIFLDVRTTRPPLRGSNPELLELEIVAAASIASFALGHGYRAGLYVNQNQRLSNEPIRIPPSQHTDQLMHILEALAQLHPSETTPIDRLVLYEGRNLHWGSTLVVISAAPTDTLTSTLLKMKRVGRRVSLILVGGKEPAAGNNGLNVYHVPDDVRWRDLEELPLRGNNHQ